MKKHYPGHQQALIKNNICIAALSFSKHSFFLFRKTFKKFDYDTVVDMCSSKISTDFDPIVGGYWNGKQFSIKPYDSWVMDDNLQWKAPKDIPYQIDDHENFRWIWNEANLEWDLAKRPESKPENCCPE